MFIKEIIDASDKAILITRPRRWGKTLNLEMLQSFFAPAVYENGKIKESNENRILFEGGEIELNSSGDKHICQKLNISSIDNGAYMRYQGKYPVIFISFKNVKGDSYESIKTSVRLEIRELFKRHRYLKNSAILEEDGLRTLQRFIDADLVDVGGS